MLSNVMHKVSQVFNHQDTRPSLDWDDDFSEISELEALIQVKDILTKVDLLQKTNIKGKVKLILDLDEKAYRNLQSITHRYLTSLGKGEKLKATVEGAVYEYLRQLNRVYTHIISDYLHQNQLMTDDEKINLILVRYLNAIFMTSKWNYFNKQPASLGTWANIHKAINIAESLSIMNKHLFLYDFQNKETSIASLLERGFMLDTLQKESYTPLQFELTDRVLKTWTSNLVISKEFKADEYQFFIHLDDESRPQRLRSAKPHPDFRYWKTTIIVDLIETYLCAVDTRKSLDEFNLITMAATEDIVKLFRKLRVDWCVKGYKRQRRKGQRNKSLNMLNVCYGIDGIFAFAKNLQVNAVAAEKEAEPVDETIILGGADSPAVFTMASNQDGALYGFENWTMLEESKSGFSVELKGDINVLVRIGALVGYAVNDNKNTVAIAEIKNVKKTENGTYRVGLNKLASNVATTTVSRLGVNSGPATVSGYDVDDGAENLSHENELAGILINSKDATKLKVITPTNHYVRAGRYKVNINDEDHIVLAGEVVNIERDWICFEVIAKSQTN